MTRGVLLAGGERLGDQPLGLLGLLRVVVLAADVDVVPAVPDVVGRQLGVRRKYGRYSDAWWLDSVWK